MNKTELIAAYVEEGLPLCCHWCQRNFDEKNEPTLEHMTPRALGGTKDRHNLVLACWPCNHVRGELFHEEQEKDMRGHMTLALAQLEQAPFPLRRLKFIDHPDKRMWTRILSRLLREKYIQRPCARSRHWMITERGREYLDAGLKRKAHAERHAERLKRTPWSTNGPS